MDEDKRLQKAIKEAAASVLLEKLPLSKEYVEDYYIKKLSEMKNEEGAKLVLKRGDKSGR